MNAPAGVRILIADDHTIVRQGLRLLLEREPGFEVAGEAADGVQAAQMVRELRPDVLLLDMNMPSPGLSALRALSEERAPVGTIVLTGDIDSSQTVEALRLGARGVLLKSCSREVLVQGIRCVAAGGYWIDKGSVSVTAAGEPSPRRFGLTPRELEIVGAVLAGGTNRDIAQQFSISQETVKHHLTRIFDKVGVSTRLELALFALHHGLVALP